MTHAELLERAKQGDAGAIAALITRTLQPKGITAKARLKGTTLQTILEANPPPNRLPTIQTIQATLTELGCPDIKRVQLIGRRIGANSPDWLDAFELKPNTNFQKPKIPPKTVSDPTHPSAIHDTDRPSARSSTQPFPKIPFNTADTIDRPRSQPEDIPQDSETIAIQQAFQAIFGNDIHIRISRTKRQLAIVVQRPESVFLSEADLLSVLETLELHDSLGLAMQGLEKLKILEQINDPETPTKPQQIFELNVKDRTHNNLEMANRARKAGKKLFIRVIALACTVMTASCAVIFIDRKQQTAIEILDPTDYCPETVQLTNKPEQAKATESIEGTLTRYYPPVQVTGPVFREGGASTSCVHLNLHISKAFDDKQKQIIIRSSQIMAQRILQNKTYQCAYRNAYRDYQDESPSEDEKTLRDSFWRSSVYVDEKTVPVVVGVEIPSGGELYIDGFSAQFSMAHGLALLDLFEQEEELRINLNADYIGRRLDYYGYLLPNGPELWAGVIAHEMMHNLGWIHPNGYEGTVIMEFGKCVSGDGEDLPRLPIGWKIVSALMTTSLLVLGLLIGQYFWLKRLSNQSA